MKHSQKINSKTEEHVIILNKHLDFVFSNSITPKQKLATCNIC